MNILKGTRTTATRKSGTRIGPAVFIALLAALWTLRANGAADWNFPVAWEARLTGQQVTGMAVDADGSVFVTGGEVTEGGKYNYLTAKTDSAGHLVWLATFGGGQAAYATALAIDAQDNCYVTGYLLSTNKPTGADNDYLTIKYDANGNGIWTNQWDANPTQISWDQPYAIVLDEAGQSYILGTSGTIMLSSNGVVVWVNTSTACRQLQSSTLKQSGGYLYATIPVGASWNSQLFELNTTNGQTLWQKPAGALQSFVALTTDSNGCVYTLATSNYNSSTPSGAVVASKFDTTGSNIWTTSYNGPFNNLAYSEYPNSIAVGADSSVYIAGTTWNTSRPSQGIYDGSPYDALTLKLDPSGNLAWASTYHVAENWDEFGAAIVVDESGDAYVAGSASITSAQGTTADGLLLKYDGNGNLLWASRYAKKPTGSQGSELYCLNLGKPGQVVCAGFGSYQAIVTGYGGPQNLTDFLVLDFDENTPQLLIRKGGGATQEMCLVSPRWSQFEILANADLGSTNWQSLGTVVNLYGLMPFSDKMVWQYPARSYRARQQTP